MKTVIEALVYIVRHNIALRGHNENDISLNRGNILELITLIANYYPLLKKHLNVIKLKIEIVSHSYRTLVKMCY